MGKKSWLRAGVLAATVVLPGAAIAHTVLVSPPPRDVNKPGNDGHKLPSAPCGMVAKTNRYVQYEAGATIDVTWKETIDHVGCFQIALSTADADTNFTVLKQINDEAGTPTPANYTTSIQLPPNVTCKSCTLQLRQLMQNGPCTANADPALAANGTYFSCADICIGTDCPPLPPPDEDAGSSSSSSSSTGGPSTQPTDGGGKLVDAGSSSGSRAASLGGDDGGCSVGTGATTGAAFASAVAVLGVALVRRRRRTDRR